MPKLKLKIGDLYEVTWYDAFGTTGWHTADFYRDYGPSECKTVGYYLGTTKCGDLLFAATHDLVSDLYNGVTGRPKQMIKKVKRLKHGRK